LKFIPLFYILSLSQLPRACMQIKTCHSERLEGATPSRRFGAGENLGLLPEIAFENEILTALDLLGKSCSAQLPRAQVPWSVVASLLTPLRGLTTTNDFAYTL
jgi:hypothetical protein